MDLSDDDGNEAQIKQLVAAVSKHEKTLESLKEVPALLNSIMSKLAGPTPKSVFDISEDEGSNEADTGMQSLLQNILPSGNGEAEAIKGTAG